MKHKLQQSLNTLILAGASALTIGTAVRAETLSFDGKQAAGVTTHTLNATDWADYVGGSTTFNSANAGGRLYWRGSAGDGQYIHFDLSSLTGLTLVAPATVTLQDANPTWGGGVDGSFVATADSAWIAGGGQTVPGATAIANAVNAAGSYGWDAAISWNIGYSTFQNIVDNPGSFNGLAVIGGSGSQMHFDAVNPYLTVKTGTLSDLTGVVTADTGSSTWNAANYSFAATSAYSPILNTLTISGALIEGISGAGSVTINNGGTVAVSPAGNVNYYQALDGTTVNAGGKLTINGHSNISNLTLAGGELASTGTDATWGSWGINGATTVNGGLTSTISAQQVTLSSGVFNVDMGSTLNFTGSTRAGSLTKNGTGAMVITGYQSYADGTTVNEGTLEVIGQNSGWGWLRNSVTVNAGGTLKFTGGDGTGFGWNSPVTSLTVDGGTFDVAVGTHVGFGAYMTAVLKNGGTIAGNFQWANDYGLGFSTSGDSINTISGNLNLRGDGGTGNHTFNVADGTSDVDLQVSANLSDQWPEANWVPRGNVVKAGSGTMVISGSNSYDGQTDIQAGTLVAASSSALGPGGWDGNTMSFVEDGATLALQGGVSLDEHMHVWGVGIGGNGAIRSISGNNALSMTYGNSGSGPGFCFRKNTTVGVDADMLTVTGFYEDGGSWGLTKVGAGTLCFSSSSTYTGGTTINAGTLKVDNVSALSSGAVTLSGGTLEVGVADAACSSLGGTAGTLKVSTDKKLVVSGSIAVATLAIEIADPQNLSAMNEYTLATCTGMPSGTYALKGLSFPWVVDARDGALVLRAARGTMFIAF